MTTLEKLNMNVKQVNSDFQAIKNKIVANGVDVADGTRTAEYAAKVDEVYEAGKKSQYDEFWDAYQREGKRVSYQYGGFGGEGWTDETYKPKYPVRPVYAYQMYTGCMMTEVLNVDTSLANALGQLFYVCHNLIRVGVISTVSVEPIADSLSYAFARCEKLVTIDKIIVNENVVFSTTTFYNSTSLENLIIEGTIGQNGFNVQWSTKLSKASIISIINALSTTTSGLSVTLSKTAVNNAFDGGSEGAEWLALRATKSNWTISLV